MILDNLAQWRRYAGLSPRFAAAFQYLERLDPRAEAKRHDIDGDNLYALVQTYKTKPTDDALFEAHRRYIDIQYVLTGDEAIFWAPLQGMGKVTTPYDEKIDAALFEFKSPALPVHVGPKQFTILFPEDAHVPGRIWEKPSDVFKVVVKVKI